MKVLRFIPLLFLAVSCTKTGSSPVLMSFDITYHGRNYVMNQTTASPYSPVVITDSVFNFDSCRWFYIMALGDSLFCTITGIKRDTASKTGTYKSGAGPMTTLGELDIIEYTDNGQQYGSNHSGADTNSVIEVTEADANEIKGTFSVLLTVYRRGPTTEYYPATGHFDIKR